MYFCHSRCVRAHAVLQKGSHCELAGRLAGWAKRGWGRWHTNLISFHPSQCSKPIGKTLHNNVKPWLFFHFALSLINNPQTFSSDKLGCGKWGNCSSIHDCQTSYNTRFWLAWINECVRMHECIKSDNWQNMYFLFCVPKEIYDQPSEIPETIPFYPFKYLHC